MMHISAYSNACVIRRLLIHGCVVTEGHAASEQNPYYTYAHQVSTGLYFPPSCENSSRPFLHHNSGGMFGVAMGNQDGEGYIYSFSYNGELHLLN